VRKSTRRGQDRDEDRRIDDEVLPEEGFAKEGHIAQEGDLHGLRDLDALAGRDVVGAEEEGGESHAEQV
jgi:hypothetical protein